jgi:hypothetical protein
MPKNTAMNTIDINLVYPKTREESRTPLARAVREAELDKVLLPALPRVGDYFQHPYGKGTRFKVKAVVFEANSDACIIFVELEAA